jgi:hypothetical protein
MHGNSEHLGCRPGIVQFSPIARWTQDLGEFNMDLGRAWALKFSRPGLKFWHYGSMAIKHQVRSGRRGPWPAGLLVRSW